MIITNELIAEKIFNVRVFQFKGKDYDKRFYIEDNFGEIDSLVTDYLAKEKIHLLLEEAKNSGLFENYYIGYNKFLKLWGILSMNEEIPMTLSRHESLNYCLAQALIRFKEIK